MGVFEDAREVVSSRSYIESTFGVPGARWSEDKYFTKNPTRPDREIGSFVIYENGTYKDYATNEHGDIIDLLAAINGEKQIDIAMELTGNRRAPMQAGSQAKQPGDGEAENKEGFGLQERKIRLDWKPIPEGSLPKFSVQPDNLTLYLSDKDEPMFFVVRYNSVGPRKKQIYPIYWTGSSFEKGLPPGLDYRPLLWFDRDKTVVVVEGERKCETASLTDELSSYAFTTWHGGCGAASKAMWGKLEGCDVILWPDNDEVGRQAMSTIAHILKDIAKSVRIVDVPKNLPQGWDIADAINEGRGVRELLEMSSAFVFDEVIDDIDSIPCGKTEGRPYTDLGNAERLVDLFGANLRYSIEKNKWLIWNGIVWSDEDQTKIVPKWKYTVRSIPNGKDAASIAWARSSESSGSINAMLKLASGHPGIPVNEERLDKEEHIIAVKNGYVDLRSGNLIDPRKEALCTKQVECDYNKEAKCDMFLKFMSEIFLGNMSHVKMMQRWFGYCLTSSVSAQSFLIMYGSGSNGKSTLVELILKIMGGYARTAPPDMFIQKSGSSIPNDVAYLRGVRMALTSETEANSRLAESKIKSLTGGDRVTARYMRGEFFQFDPTWKIIISTNHKPRVMGSDHGIWRRIIVVPFLFRATPENIIPDLAQKLYAEKEGILAWMVDGAVGWYADGGGRGGLAIPNDIFATINDYRDDEDTLGRFILEQCYTTANNPKNIPVEELKSGATPLYKTFVAWAEEEGEKGAASMTQTTFGRTMGDRGYVSERTRDGKMYSGIRAKGSI